MSETTIDTVPDNLRPYLTEIAERLWSGRAAVMVGAGFSKNATPNSASDSGFPDWSQLGDLFYEKIHGRKPNTESKYLNVLKLADEVQAAFGRSALNQILRDAIPDYDYEPSPLPESLLNLPWSDVFTTNYDTLLERASNVVTSQRYDVIVNMEDLVYSKKPRIVKLHGSFPSDRPFIITEEDYRCYPENFAPFVNTVRQALLENTLCLIGFSGDDPNFLQWIGWIRDNLGQQNSPKMYFIGLFSLSDAQKKLLERRNIILVDLSEYPDINGDHYKALEQFLDYLLSRKAEDNRLGWPEDSEYLTPDRKSEKLAQLSKLLVVWEKQRLLYPGWVVIPEDRRRALWSFTQHWINYLSEQDDIFNFIDFKFAFELNWRMEKCLCPILSQKIAFFEAILDRYLPLLDMETPLEQISATSEAMNLRELNRSDIRNMCHHLILSMMRHYREQGSWEKWETFRDKIQQDMVNLSSEHQAIFHYECALFSFFRLNLQELKKQLAEWEFNESLPFWEAKRAGLLAEIGQLEEAKNILENLLKTIRSKLNLNPITTDYSLVSQESFVRLLLKYVQMSVSFIQAKGTEPDSQELEKESTDRWNALKQYKCDPWNELEIFERSLEQPPVKRSQVTKKKEFDIGRVTQTHHFDRWDSEALIAYNFLHFCEDAGIPFRIPGVTVVKKSAEGTLSRIVDYSPYWAMASMVRIGDEKVIDHIFHRSLLYRIDTAYADYLVTQYLTSLGQSVADIRSGNSFYADNFGIILAKVIPEILSRLCCKCSFEAKEKLLDFLLGVYQSEHRSNYGGIGNLTNRLLGAFSVQQRFDLIPRLLDFPTVEEPEFINPFQCLELNKELTENWDKPTIPYKKIEALFEEALSNDANVREGVMLILVNLHDLGLLSPDQTDRLTDVLWMRRDEFGLPSETVFYKSAFLDLPHPPDVEPKPLFKNYIQNEQFPLQQDGAPLTGGNIPICEEIIRATNYIKWLDEDICNIFDRLIEWWDADKEYLKRGSNPFFSWTDEFKARFACLIDVLVAIISPNFNISEENNRKETLRRLIGELRDYGVYALRLESACLQIYPESREDVLERIENGMASDNQGVVDDSLQAILVIVERIESVEEKKNFSQILNALGQMVRWQKNTGLPSALDLIAKLIKEHPWTFDDELERMTLIGLHSIAKDTATNAGGLDISEKLEIREAAAGLAYRLFEFYTRRDAPIPDVLKEWEAICHSENEFAEIRNQWIRQN